jgi:hypothetical protein
VASNEWFLPSPSKASVVDTIGARRVGILATSGAGKTYALMRLIELLWARKSPFVVLDPAGNFWGVRAAKTGKGRGIDVPVLGGLHGDHPLQKGSGRVVAEFLSKTGGSLVLDHSHFTTNERQEFSLAFIQRLLEQARRNRRVFTVIVDECQDYFPERLKGKRSAEVRDEFERAVLQGRNFGLGFVMASQAPQNVYKRILNLAELLLVGRLTGEHERTSVERWVKDKGVSGKAALSDVPKLENGAFFAWSPEWLDFFQRVRTTERVTFDSSKTPELGAVAPAVTAMDPGMLSALGAALEASVTPAESEDDDVEPAKAARSRRAPKGGARPFVEAKERELLSRVQELGGLLETASDRVVQLEGELEDARDVIGHAHGLSDKLRALLEAWPPTVYEPSSAKPNGHVTPRESVRKESGKHTAKVVADARAVERYVEQKRTIAQAGPPANGIDKGMAAMLGVLAAQKEPIDRKRLGFLAGYSPRVSTFRGILTRLRQAAYIDGSADALVITPLGRSKAPKVELPPKGGQELFEWWIAHPKVDTCMRKILWGLWNSPRGKLGRRQLAERSGIDPDKSTYRGGLTRLRKLGLVEGKASEYVRLVDAFGRETK